MEFRKVFDTIPEQFDKYRCRYCKELFAKLITYAELSPEKSVLELGPGTGQATEPILNTGCDYNAIELGEHLYEMMKSCTTRFSRCMINTSNRRLYIRMVHSSIPMRPIMGTQILNNMSFTANGNLRRTNMWHIAGHTAIIL